jgi:hypothetical protein
MGIRIAKIRRISHFLTNRSGITFTTATKELRIQGPRPYDVRTVTSRSLKDHSAAVRQLPDEGISFVVRFDSEMESMNDAWATMRLGTACELLKTYDERK